MLSLTLRHRELEHTQTSRVTNRCLFLRFAHRAKKSCFCTRPTGLPLSSSLFPDSTHAWLCFAKTATALSRAETHPANPRVTKSWTPAGRPEAQSEDISAAVCYVEPDARCRRRMSKHRVCASPRKKRTPTATADGSILKANCVFINAAFIKSPQVCTHVLGGHTLQAGADKKGRKETSL